MDGEDKNTTDSSAPGAPIRGATCTEAVVESITPGHRSMEDVHHTVTIPQGGHWMRRMLAFAGPAYLVAVGYMDPGNWATDIEGGARFGYRLLWVLLMSNLMAVVLQTLSARLGLVTGRDLAQACRDSYPPVVNWILFVLCEIAIAACDLAEVLGTALGLKLLTGIPLIWGVVITGLDVFLLLAIQRWGMRRMEAFIISLVSMIGACFIVEIFLSKPSPAGVVKGLIPTAMNGEMLYIAIGILGATVMPHNLYLHSALVQSRNVARTRLGVRIACRYNMIDSFVALNLAFFVNAAILIVAGATFFGRAEVHGIENAHLMLERLLGSRVAPIAFALALVCAGQSSTITGTLAGQITMEGFLHFRMRPWLRRLITRSLAIIPAVFVIGLSGEGGTGNLLVLSQVILSLQLPFAVVPLVKFTASKQLMRDFASHWIVAAAAWLIAAIIIGLNAQLVVQTIQDWAANAGAYRVPVIVLSAATAGSLGMLLLYMTFRREAADRGRVPVSVESLVVAAAATETAIRRVGVALEGVAGDAAPLAEAIRMARAHNSELVLMHVVEGVGGQFHGDNADDAERRLDEQFMRDLATRLAAELTPHVPAVRACLGYGDVIRALATIVNEGNIDVVITGGHGHRRFADVLRGETINGLRHRIRVPVFSVRAK